MASAAAIFGLAGGVQCFQRLWWKGRCRGDAILSQRWILYEGVDRDVAAGL